MKKTIISMALLATVFAGGGCASGVATVKTTEQRSFPQYVDTRIEYRDVALSKNVFVEVIEASVGTNNLMRLQLRFANRTNVTRNYYYKLIWVDENGFEMDLPKPKWQEISILPYEEKAVSQAAYSPKATDFRIQIAKNI